MTLRELKNSVGTHIKVYIGGELVYTPLKGDMESLLERKVVWLNSEDDILEVGLTRNEGSEKHEKE